MIKYLIPALILIVYFEILGQYLLFRLNRECKGPAMGIGFLLLMAYAYPTVGLISGLHGPFVLALGIFMLFFIGSIFLMIRDRRKVKWFFDPKQWIVILVLADLLIYYAYDTKLGDLSTYGPVYYLNLIASNIGASSLNMTDLYRGTPGVPLSASYSMQAYYVFASCVTYLTRPFLALSGPVLNSGIIIWIFQILYDFFFVSSLIFFFNSVNEKRYLLKAAVLFAFVFYFGKLYYNSVYGFCGNTYRMFCTAYSVMFLDELLKDNTRENRFLFTVSVWGACAFSFTSVFISILMVFASYFVLADKDDGLFRFYAVLLSVPLTDFLLNFGPQNIFLSLAVSALLCLSVFLLNGPLVRISRIRMCRYAILGLSFLAMFFLSLKVTGSITDFSAFFNNGSELNDTSINYFYLSEDVSRKTFIILVLSSGLLAMLLKIRKRLYMAFWILIIVFFNPFCCSFLAVVFNAYYRAYDIIINPFTVILFMNTVFDVLKNRYFYYGVLTLVLVLFYANTSLVRPVYNDYTFEPREETFDHLEKMDKDEIEIISKIRELSGSYGINQPYIITDNFLTQSNIPDSRYLYVRDYVPEENASASELYLCDVFKRNASNSLGTEDTDYEDLLANIADAGIDFIVIDYQRSYEDYDYLNLINHLIAAANDNAVYANDSYSLLMFGN